MIDAVIVSAVRTPVGKAPQGQLRFTRPDDLAATALQAALARVPGLDPALVDDVVIGCAMPEAEQGLNVARIASLRAGIPHTAAAVTVNRFCASGLEAIAKGQHEAARHASSITHSPSSMIRPDSSARVMNWLGGTTPRLGWCQRIRASKPIRLWSTARISGW